MSLVGYPTSSLRLYPRSATRDPWIRSSSCDRNLFIIHHLWTQSCCMSPRNAWPHSRRNEIRRVLGLNREAVYLNLGAPNSSVQITDPHAVEDHLNLNSESTPRSRDFASSDTISSMHSMKNAVNVVCGSDNAVTSAIFCRKINTLSIFKVHGQMNNSRISLMNWKWQNTLYCFVTTNLVFLLVLINFVDRCGCLYNFKNSHNASFVNLFTNVLNRFHHVFDNNGEYRVQPNDYRRPQCCFILLK